MNNDGRPDVLLTQYGGIRLFLNRGGGQFEDVTAESGLEQPVLGHVRRLLRLRPRRLARPRRRQLPRLRPQERLPVAGGQEGLLRPERCFPVRAASCSTTSAPSREDGKPGRRFEDVSFASGLGRLPGPGLGVVCADFDGDGWPDIFVANDGKANRLWINRHDGTFVDEAASRGVAYTSMGKAFADMGVALGDVTDDGLLDLYVSHLERETNTLVEARATRPVSATAPSNSA